MSEIKLLDQHTINKIAAGEVVERPSSVVKELVENAIDAGASAITVEIKEGGISFIRITDNGIGIPKKDIQTAFVRHSTSKIKSIEDLMTVSSLGFRGEALASIAAVSQIEVISKTYDDLTGIRYVIEGGQEIAMEEIGCPEGTTIIIKNLFYNTPARRKFLKKPATEGAHISDFVNKLALGHMEISFKFIYNNAIKLHTSGNNILKDCILNVYDKEIVKSIMPFAVKGKDFEINGFIGKPQVCRANRTYETYYINGRYVKSKFMMKAIEDGYRTKLTVHKYPFVVLHMTINPDLIDVNVHPTKMEIRFRNEMEIYETIKNGIDQHLRRIDLIPEVPFGKTQKVAKETPYDKRIPEPFENKRREQLDQGKSKGHTPIIPSKTVTDTLKNRVNHMESNPNQSVGVKEQIPHYPSSNYPQSSIHKTITDNNIKNNIMITNRKVLDQLEQGCTDQLEQQTDTGVNKAIEVQTKESIERTKSNEQGVLFDSKFIDKKTVKNHKVIGQLFHTYWIVELEGKFYFIDQHAAHERVLYERLMQQLEESGIMSQGLLQPLIIHVSMKEIQLIKDYMEVFQELGFEIEAFGKDAYAIRSVPYIFTKSLTSDQFLDILDSLHDHYDQNKYQVILKDIATMACKAAVKAHDKLSLIEYETLFDELLSLDNPYTCPHGRPTIISMTQYELEKKFKRIQ